MDKIMDCFVKITERYLFPLADRPTIKIGHLYQ